MRVYSILLVGVDASLEAPLVSAGGAVAVPKWCLAFGGKGSFGGAALLCSCCVGVSVNTHHVYSSLCVGGAGAAVAAVGCLSAMALCGSSCLVMSLRVLEVAGGVV